MSIVITELRADKEAHSRELIEKGLKLEADLRATEPLRNEVIGLHAEAEAQKLTAIREELAGQVQNLSQELPMLQADNQQTPLLRSELGGVRRELVRQCMPGGAFGMKFGSPEGAFPTSYGDGYSLHPGAANRVLFMVLVLVHGVHLIRVVLDVAGIIWICHSI